MIKTVSKSSYVYESQGADYRRNKTFCSMFSLKRIAMIPCNVSMAHLNSTGKKLATLDIRISLFNNCRQILLGLIAFLIASS